MAKYDWTVTGQLTVEHQLGELKTKFGGKSPLKNIQVKVSAKTKALGGWGTWNSWGIVRANSSGVFTISNSKNGQDRRFKVEVKFQDDTLEVRHEKSTSSTTKVKWYTVVEETDTQHGPGTVKLGDRTFSTGGKHDLSDFEARRHADIWVLYQMAIGRLKDMGRDFEFTTRVKPKHPHDGITGDNVEASYANPTTKVIYIVKNSKRDDFDTDIMLHELGHIFAYNHMSGEICLTEALFLSGTTHGLVDKPCVAFNEGFAEYWKDKMMEELFGHNPRLPYNRAYLSYGGWWGDKLTNLTLMQRHDEGWRSVFHTLTTPNLHQYDFKEAYRGGSAPSKFIELKSVQPLGCSSPSITFKDVLKVFNENSSKGYPKKLSRSETTISSFLTRAAAILNGLSSEDRDLYQELVDPSKTTQPSDKLCEPAKVAGVHQVRTVRPVA